MTNKEEIIPYTEDLVIYVFLARYIINTNVSTSFSPLKMTTFATSSALIRFSKGNRVYLSSPNLIHYSIMNITKVVNREAR
jgi:hypothetical protein